MNQLKRNYHHIILLGLALGFAVIALTRCEFTAQPNYKPSPAPSESPSPGGCCEKAWPGTHDGATHLGIKGTGYFPFNNAMEGGTNDRMGRPLKTVQAFLAGKADAVTVAMDYKIAPYGAKLCSPELNKRYGKPLPLELKDTGGAFYGRKWERADLCTASKNDSLDSAINGKYSIVECK